MPRFRSVTISPGFDAGEAAGLLVNTEGTLTTNNLPLRSLIAFAYDLQDTTISGPESLDRQRYSITAEPERVPALPPQIDEFRLVVRELLAARFGLEFHWETRPSKALVLSLRAVAPGLKRAAQADPGPLLRLRDASSISLGNASLEPLFTSWLSTRFGTPVFDRTGLSGNYNFDLKWESASDAALRQALLVQLGLTLEAIEADIEHLVVDRVDPPTDLAPKPVEVAIGVEILDRYVGRYAFASASVMSIVRDGPKLFSQLDRQTPVEIFPAGETEFFAKAIPARIQFVVDGGAVIALVLQQGGREIRAPRLRYADAPKPTHPRGGGITPGS